MTQRQAEAVHLFEQGYNCAQAVFAAYADIYGMDRETSLKISCSFGGGMGRMREVCGTVSAMALVAGLENGNIDVKDKKAKTENYELVREMAEEFRKKNGTLICRELLGIGKKEEGASPSERTAEFYKKRPCIKLVEEAAGIIEQHIIRGKETHE